MMFSRPVRFLLLAGLAASAAGCHSSQSAAQRGEAAAAKMTALAAQCRGGGQAALKPGKPLWVDHGRLTDRGRELLRDLATVGQDGLNPRDYLPSGTPTEQALSDSLVRLAGDLAQPPPGLNIHYVDDPLQPVRPCAGAVLSAAASSRLADLLQGLRQPNGAAAALWRALQTATSPQQRADLVRDLALARSMGPGPKALLVDTTSAQLWEIAGPNVAGQMKVVVGTPGPNATPPLAALVQWSDVNPYWYVPPDLVSQDIAPRVLKEGVAYLQQHHYQAVDSYDDDTAHVLNPATVNWEAVESGKSDVGVRQVPNPHDMLGRVDFVFPNEFGIYLHDTPGRWVFAAPDRHLSHGCIRLENAAQLFRFLFGIPLPRANPNDPDDEFTLKQPVPIFAVPLSPEGATALNASVQPPRKVRRFLGIKIADVAADFENAVGAA